ncbi:suppressor of fused homolog [Panonychus citri]|uniref:suppressor of fused homolog n=1 Tax=Panonychus citri TaxID=50023 RepID=UPI0023079AE1|nr:suppressor of fused homolog [Panonychus citri]
MATGREFLPYLPGSLTPISPYANAIPPGLGALYAACRRLYPDQPNPLQVTANVKYWFGGPDPLDYISMYSNPGDPSQNIPPHWHYISFGLSDLYGDGRVHQPTDQSSPSGYGFELTFRLKKDDEPGPPTWPAMVMQALAKYVFQSENVLCAGDHVSWHCSLDNSESRIEHMLMTEDPQLGTINTPFGGVTFIQIVGVCLEELKAAQQWNGPGIIELMKTVEVAGGPWLVTNMRRGETIFEIDTEIQESVDKGIIDEGSNLSGVSAKCAWSDKPFSNSDDDSNDEDANSDSDSDYGENHPILERGNLSHNHPNHLSNHLNHNTLNNNTNLNNNNSSTNNNCHTNNNVNSCGSPIGGMSSPTCNSRNSNMSITHDQQNQSNSRMSYASETGAPEPGELLQTKFIEKIYLRLNLEAGLLLPLALRGRLKHGRHFTFKSILGDLAITFVTPSVSGSHVNEEQPYAIHGPWLQILIPDRSIDTMLKDLKELNDLDFESLPRTYEWPELNLTITLMPEENFN